MFRQRPRLPVDFYFPTFRNAEGLMREASAKCVDEYVATVWDQLRTALQRLRLNWQQKPADKMVLWPEDRHHEPEAWCDLVLVKDDAFKGKRKIRNQWEEETCEVVHQIATDIPSYEVMDQHGQSHILHRNRLLLIASEVGIPLCIGVCHALDRCTSPTPCKPTSEGSEDAKRELWVGCYPTPSQQDFPEVD